MEETHARRKRLPVGAVHAADVAANTTRRSPAFRVTAQRVRRCKAGSNKAFEGAHDAVRCAQAVSMGKQNGRQSKPSGDHRD